MKLQSLSKPSNRWALALIITGTAITGIIASRGISQVKQTQPPAKIVATAPKVQQVTALGRLELATEVIKLSVPTNFNNNRVSKLLVKRGDRVTVGQLIATMDSHQPLQTALLEAKAHVKVAQAELAKVKAGAKSGEIAAQEAEIARLQKQLEGEIASQQATIARWQAEVTNANADYNRYLSLYKQGAIAASELDRRRLVLETAQAQFNEAKAKEVQSTNTLREQIRQAKATLNRIAEVRPVDVQAAQADVDKAIAAVTKAKADLVEAYIRAPIAGRILDIYAKSGEAVGDKGIADLGQTDQMQVVAEVYQTDISKIREGQQATIVGESFLGKLQGTISLVGLKVTQQEITSGQPGENLDRKVIEVRIRLNPEASRRVANLTNMQVQVAIEPNAQITSSR